MTVTSEAAFLDPNAATADVATYCADPTVEKINENYCPGSADQEVTPVLDTLPIGWDLRVIFNELLFADAAEDLINCIDGNHDGQCLNIADGIDIDDGGVYGSLVNTQPVTLSCGGQPIPYDGYYQPSGNQLTVPAGPGLVIQPIFPAGFAATGSNCQVTVNADVQSKELETMGFGGPIDFQIAPMRVYEDETDPADGAVVAPEVQIAILFNAYVDANTLTNIEVVDGMGNPHPIRALAFDDVVIVSSDNNGAFDAATDYTLTVNTGVADIRGGTFTGPYQTTFSTM